jgi:hypothetical protein
MPRVVKSFWSSEKRSWDEESVVTGVDRKSHFDYRNRISPGLFVQLSPSRERKTNFLGNSHQY